MKSHEESVAVDGVSECQPAACCLLVSLKKRKQNKKINQTLDGAMRTDSTITSPLSV